MILKGFFWNILFRVVFITLTSFALVYFAPQLNEELYFTFIGLALLLLLQVYFLVVYVNKINNNLSYLLESISDENFTFSFKNHENDGVSDKLQQSVDNVRKALQDKQIKHLKKDVYLENIVTHVDIGLFLIDEQGGVDLLNPAAKTWTASEGDVKEYDERFITIVGKAVVALTWPPTQLKSQAYSIALGTAVQVRVIVSSSHLDASPETEVAGAIVDPEVTTMVTCPV